MGLKQKLGLPFALFIPHNHTFSLSINLNKTTTISLSLSLSLSHTSTQIASQEKSVFYCLKSETMKQKTVSYALLLLFVFLITSSQISAGRFLPNKQGKEEEVKLENGTNTQLMKPETTDSLEKLMGLEKCESRDEECMKRRVVAEAHLDYIYTQHQNP